MESSKNANCVNNTTTQSSSANNKQVPAEQSQITGEHTAPGQDVNVKASEQSEGPTTTTASSQSPPGDTEDKSRPESIKRKTSTEHHRNNGCSRMHSQISSEDDDFCDCDTCLLGFDDTRPGEVFDQPRIKRTPVIILVIIGLIRQK